MARRRWRYRRGRDSEVERGPSLTAEELQALKRLKDSEAELAREARALGAARTALARERGTIDQYKEKERWGFLFSAGLCLGLPVFFVWRTYATKEAPAAPYIGAALATWIVTELLLRRHMVAVRCAHGIPSGGKRVECAACTQALREQAAQHEVRTASLGREAELRRRDFEKSRESARADRLSRLRAREDLLQQSPIGFEQTVADLLRSNGYAVKLTKASGDRGIDVMAERGGVRAVVQCKRYGLRNGVGIDEVQRMVGVMKQEGAHVSILFTTSYFTSEAVIAARAIGVRLIDGSSLIDILGGRRSLDDAG